MFRVSRATSRLTRVFNHPRRTAVAMAGVAASTATVTFIYRSFSSSSVRLKGIIDVNDFMAQPITPMKHLEKTMDSIPTRMELMILDAQAKLIRSLQEVEAEHSNTKFRVDRWERAEGGGGIACVLQDGQVFEKAGVNISVVEGDLTKGALQHMKSRGRDFGEGPHRFKAMGISSVIHPRNPNVPTLHFNYRYFEVVNGRGDVTWWFGGGSDLTPYYLDKDDVRHFHQTLKNACDRHNPQYYPRFKKWCDEYFFITHRGFSRGVGGIFFDDLDDKKAETMLKFVTECASSVIPSYVPLVKKNKDRGYGYKERDWQLIRRGHYAEFNLVHDRGTKFGLSTPGGRIEAILMSLPLNARWVYEHQPEPGSEEAALLEVLLKPKDWV
ncbi:oxygen-dependent coproporphyrinogen-III oxidase [Galendromus occidentalis]|uniref:coproporphyrinogen oxidase n=1 Tax=Galendromus occidentalis TaxID=34638 RepID=A0AAJ6QV05_9ACAR|nr:oxygen-dependent coproporphyrinogen-III oxidase [Galendromus occidentalis]